MEARRDPFSPRRAGAVGARARTGPPPPELLDDELDLLLEAVHRRYHHDFRGYARASLRRRVVAAMDDLGVDTGAEVVGAVERDAAVFAVLLRFLTVPVTEMFRDPEFYVALRAHAVPWLRAFPRPRVWIAGCSTGEEAYSVAVLLEEEGLLDRATIIATDICGERLRTAAAGVYPTARAQSFSRNHQAAGGRRPFVEYYAAGYGAIVVARRLRDAVTFADHSLATDARFGEFDLVLCRNVLIYFGNALQERAVGVIHASLASGGLLGLGARETLRFTRWAGAFDPVVGSGLLRRR